RWRCEVRLAFLEVQLASAALEVPADEVRHELVHVEWLAGLRVAKPVLPGPVQVGNQQRRHAGCPRDAGGSSRRPAAWSAGSLRDGTVPRRRRDALELRAQRRVEARRIQAVGAVRATLVAGIAGGIEQHA